MRESLGEEILERLKREFPYSDTEFLMTFIRVIHFQHAVPILFDQYFSKMGLSKARFMVLIQLYIRADEEGLGISEINTFYSVSSATMTGVIDTLEKEGFVTRTHSKKDRRRIILKLTDQGKMFMRRFIPTHSTNLKNMMRAFSTEDLKRLMQLNAKLVESIEKFLMSDLLKVPDMGYEI